MLTSDQRSRARGSVLASAVGDALGAPYEFRPPISSDEDVVMQGGGLLGWDPGEWTDDTSMAIVVLETAADRAPLESLEDESGLDQIAQGWHTWAMAAEDIGILTSKVISRASESARKDGRHLPRAEDFRRAADTQYREGPQSAGNGSLMRVGAVVVSVLGTSEEETLAAVRAVGLLTHRADDAQDACTLWACAIRLAILDGVLDVRVGMRHLPEERRGLWLERIAHAEENPPETFSRNGWVVNAFQAAWSAIHGAGPVPEDKYQRRTYLTRVLERAVRAGYDTDTVACIAGQLVGGLLGHKAVFPEYRRALFGWPGYGAEELNRLVDRVLDLDDQRLAAREQ